MSVGTPINDTVCLLISFIPLGASSQQNPVLASMVGGGNAPVWALLGLIPRCAKGKDRDAPGRDPEVYWNDPCRAGRRGIKTLPGALVTIRIRPRPLLAASSCPSTDGCPPASHGQPCSRPHRMPTARAQPLAATRQAPDGERTRQPCWWRDQPCSSWRIRASSSSRRERAPAHQETRSPRSGSTAPVSLADASLPTSGPTSSDNPRQMTGCAKCVCIAITPGCPCATVDRS